MLTFYPDARRARIHARGASASGGSRPGEAPIDGHLVCYYPCPRCPNPARALVYLGDAGLASEVVANAEDTTRHLGLLAVGPGIALNGGHGQRCCSPCLQASNRGGMPRCQRRNGSGTTLLMAVGCQYSIRLFAGQAASHSYSWCRAPSTGRAMIRPVCGGADSSPRQPSGDGRHFGTPQV